MWESLVGLVRFAVFAAAHVCAGSLGSGILLVAAVARLAVLPLTLRAARAAREARARPTPKVSRSGLLSALIQMPLFTALMTTIRRGLGAGVGFLWIDDLAKPSALLAGLVASLSVAIVATAPRAAGQPQPPTALLLISGALTLAFLWSASSALALSVGANSAVSLLQNRMLARERTAGKNVA